MQLVIDRCGIGRCLYSEEFELTSIGLIEIERASNVEPDSHSRWRADLSLLSGPVLGPFALRSEALAAEAAWIERYGLDPSRRSF